MADQSTYLARQRSDGNWESLQEGAEGPAGVFYTMGEAWKYSKLLARATKGKAFLYGEDGKIQKRKSYRWAAWTLLP